MTQNDPQATPEAMAEAMIAGLKAQFPQIDPTQVRSLQEQLVHWLPAASSDAGVSLSGLTAAPSRH